MTDESDAKPAAQVELDAQVKPAAKHKKSNALLNVMIAISTIAMIGALGLIAYPTFSDWWNRMHQSYAVAGYVEQTKDMSGAERKAMLKAAHEYNERLAANGDRWHMTDAQKREYDETLDVTGTGIMGYVTIPRIKVKLPVYHGTIDNIIGVVHEKDCFAALQKHDKNVKLEDLVGPTLYTTSVTQISALLRTLRESKHHMAVVVDEYGGTAGIITLEDILEELVGEIWDEHDDVVEDVRQQSDGSWLISGSASVDDTAEELGIKEDDDIDAVAIGGLVQEKLSRLPKVGDKFIWGDFDGTVTRATNRRVQEVRLIPRKVQDENEK